MGGRTFERKAPFCNSFIKKEGVSLFLVHLLITIFLSFILCHTLTNTVSNDTCVSLFQRVEFIKWPKLFDFLTIGDSLTGIQGRLGDGEVVADYTKYHFNQDY